jgi:5-methylcytosine-specific restriction endonuclease McrA
MHIVSLEKDKNDLKKQLAIKDEHYQKELAVKDRQLAEHREQIKIFESLLAERFVEQREEIKQIRKRKDRYVEQTVKRLLCAGKDCSLTKELEEYDIDHIIPLSLGGTEDSSNLQALCPGCHRKKTDLERTRNQGFDFNIKTDSNQDQL